MHHSAYLEHFCHHEYSENIYDRISTIGEVRLSLLYNLQNDGIFKITLTTFHAFLLHFTILPLNTLRRTIMIFVN